MVAELENRYKAIVGGVFPLRENTDRQVEGLRELLEEMNPNKFVCYQGLKHASPFIEDGVEAMAADGIKQAIGIVLAPHYSLMSVGSYLKRAAERAAAKGIRFVGIEAYHLHPKLTQALTSRITKGLVRLDQSSGGAKPVKVLFSAHSLPKKFTETGDPYEKQFFETSSLVADHANVTNWQFTWQSAGRTSEPWLGPDILVTLQQLSAEGVKGVLVAPVGFVSDHLEVLYDLDIEAKQVAAELGITLERIEMLNCDPLYLETLADEVVTAASALQVKN